ncbi:HD domain-containing protein [Desulfosarcina sp. OttesenSCG-928-B08]|nr:HD domain-containing protein [Desulfosarcina sp. OttesenSCG-928-B08]
MTEMKTARLAGWFPDFLPADMKGVFLVGGTVRDILLNRPPRDVDIVVSGDPFQAAERIAQKLGGRVVDLGKKDFSVARVASSSLIVDISPIAGGSIETDLLARDFTLNAIGLELFTDRVIDPAHGLSDLQNGIIRMVSSAALVSDPARLVRAFRFAAELGFAISSDTQAAITRHRHGIQTIAGERIWAELIRIFSAFPSAQVIRKMAETGLLTAIFPELEPAVGCVQNHHHQFDVFEHTLAAYDHLEALTENFGARFPKLAAIAEKTELSAFLPLIKYSALLHDVGKPATRQVDSDGRVHFPGHDGKSADMAGEINRRLRVSTHQHNTTCAIIRHHIRPLFLFVANQNKALTPTGKVRFFNQCGELTLFISVHAMADRLAKERRPEIEKIPFIRFCHDLALDYEVYRNRQESLPPLITGRDLIAQFGLSPSPLFKEILGKVNEQRLAGTLTHRDAALAWVRAYLGKAEKGASC